MKHSREYSDEFLNAWIDNELDHEETAQLVDALRYDPELSKRINELKNVREMVRFAYRDITPAIDTHAPGKNHSQKTFRMLAASILLVTGAVLGWALHVATQSSSNILDIAEAVQLKGVPANEEIKMVLHVTTGNKSKLSTLLDETERLLQRYKQESKKVRLDILTNGQGLQLIKAKHSPFAARIQKLQQLYDNLTFKACSKAIKRLQNKTGKTFDTLPNTIVVPSALGDIMKRQGEGWSYIKI